MSKESVNDMSVADSFLLCLVKAMLDEGMLNQDMLKEVCAHTFHMHKMTGIMDGKPAFKDPIPDEGKMFFAAIVALADDRLRDVITRKLEGKTPAEDSAKAKARKAVNDMLAKVMEPKAGKS